MSKNKYYKLINIKPLLAQLLEKKLENSCLFLLNSRRDILLLLFSVVLMTSNVFKSNINFCVYNFFICFGTYFKNFIITVCRLTYWFTMTIETSLAPLSTVKKNIEWKYYYYYLPSCNVDDSLNYRQIRYRNISQYYASRAHAKQ